MTPDRTSAGSMADEVFDEILRTGQSARTVAADEDAEDLRRAVRALGRAAGVRLRTARLEDRVLAARLDAAVWTDDLATMRRKLTPPD